MEKNCVLNHSLTLSLSLFDAPGTEAFASENVEQTKQGNKISKNHAVMLLCRVNTSLHC